MPESDRMSVDAFVREAHQSLFGRMRYAVARLPNLVEDRKGFHRTMRPTYIHHFIIYSRSGAHCPRDGEGDCWQCRTARDKAPTHLKFWRTHRTLPLQIELLVTISRLSPPPPTPSPLQRWRIGKQFCGRQFCSIYFYDCASLAQTSAVRREEFSLKSKGSKKEAQLLI